MHHSSYKKYCVRWVDINILEKLISWNQKLCSKDLNTPSAWLKRETIYLGKFELPVFQTELTEYIQTHIKQWENYFVQSVSINISGNQNMTKIYIGKEETIHTTNLSQDHSSNANSVTHTKDVKTLMEKKSCCLNNNKTTIRSTIKKMLPL